jgi:transposase InsO family protein
MCLQATVAPNAAPDLPFDLPPHVKGNYIELTLGELSISDILAAQQSDEFCQYVTQMQKNDCAADSETEILASPAKSFAKRCALANNLVVAPNMLIGDTLVPVVPASLQTLMLETAHIWDGAHLSAQKTYELLASRMAWPSLRSDTKTFISNCNTCLQLRPGNSFQVEPGYFVATEVWDQVTIDVMHMQKRNSEYKLALVAIDTFSRYAIVMPMKGETAKEQMHALRTHVLQLGSPKMLVLDRHPTYTSAEFIEFCKQNHIKLSISPGYSSNHVAIVNRVHRTLKELFAKLTAKGDDWTKEVARATLAYNSVRHPATGFAPFFLFHARNPNLKIDALMPQLEDQTSDEKRATNLITIEKAKHEVLRRFEANHKRQIAEFMRDHTKKKRDCPKVNERVFKILPLQKREGGKLAPIRAVGPFFIAKLDKDKIHALIVPQYRMDDERHDGERVKVNDLIPIGERICTPVFANVDFATRKKQ